MQSIFKTLASSSTEKYILTYAITQAALNTHQ